MFSTNILSNNIITFEDILIIGFELRKDGCLPREVADKSLSIWRNLQTPPQASKPRTYETTSVPKDPTVEAVPCHCPNPLCQCITLVPYGEKGVNSCLPCSLKHCTRPCLCPGDTESYLLFQCSKCRSFHPTEITQCPNYRCGSPCVKVTFCITCRREKNLPDPGPPRKRRKKI